MSWKSRKKKLEAKGSNLNDDSMIARRIYKGLGLSKKQIGILIRRFNIDYKNKTESDIALAIWYDIAVRVNSSVRPTTRATRGWVVDIVESNISKQALEARYYDINHCNDDNGFAIIRRLKDTNTVVVEYDISGISNNGGFGRFVRPVSILDSNIRAPLTLIQGTPEHGFIARQELSHFISQFTESEYSKYSIYNDED